MLVMTISEGSGRCIGDGGIGDDHVSGDDIVMDISVIAIFVIPILDGRGHCISDCVFSADHVNGDDLGDGYISDSFLCDAYQ